MASRLYDGFGRPAGALGLSDSGHAYEVVGDVTIVSDAAAPSPVPALSAAVLDAGALGGDGDLGITLRTGVGRAAAGLGCYFRWLDAQNWWRAYQRVYTYTYQSGTERYVSGYTQVFSHYENQLVGYTPTEYLWRIDYPTGVTHGYQDTYGIHYETRWSTSSTSSPFGGNTLIHAHYLSGSYYPGDTSDHAHYSSNFGYYTGQTRGGQAIYEQRAVYTSQPVYAERAVYSTATGYDLRLERSVAGALSTRAARQISGPFSRITVRLRGDKIDAFVAGHTTPVSTVDATHQTATKHGFGRGKPSEFENPGGNPDLLDDFYFTPLVSGSIQPPVLL